MSAERDDVEESIFVAEISGVIDSDFMSHVSPGGSSCKVLGIDTEQPIVQFGRYIFKGEYEEVIGTRLMFHETEKPESSSESATEASKDIEFDCLARKILRLQRVFLTEKNLDESASEESPEIHSGAEVSIEKTNNESMAVD